MLNFFVYLNLWSIKTNTARFKNCRFRNFRKNFIFANSIKRNISDVKNSRQRQDLSISIKDIVISPFREDFIFTKLRICKVFAIIKSSRKILNLQ